MQLRNIAAPVELFELLLTDTQIHAYAVELVRTSDVFTVGIRHRARHHR